MPTKIGNKISIASLLEAKNKEDLHHLRRLLQVPNASQLNKSELVERISSYILANAGHYVYRMDHDRYEVLLKVMKAPSLKMAFEDLSEDERYEPGYFEQYGLMFFQDASVIMPCEIQEALRQLDGKRLKEVLDRNTSWVKLTKGLLYYYGTMEVDALAELMKKYTGHDVDRFEYRMVMEDLEAYDYSIFYSKEGFSYFKVGKPEAVAAEHAMRPDLPYYPFTKAEVLRASQDEFVDRTASYRKFEKFLLDNWEMDGEEADMLMEELVDDIQNDKPVSELVANLQDNVEMSNMGQLQGLMPVLTELMNSTRQRALKGHSPNKVSEGEKKHLMSIPHMMQQQPLQAPLANITAFPTAGQASQQSSQIYDFQTKKKVGRNDPCPCGSGKKFKKCCGA